MNPRDKLDEIYSTLSKEEKEMFSIHHQQALLGLCSKDYALAYGLALIGKESPEISLVLALDIGFSNRN